MTECQQVSKFNADIVSNPVQLADPVSLAS